MLIGLRRHRCKRIACEFGYSQVVIYALNEYKIISKILNFLLIGACF